MVDVHDRQIEAPPVLRHWKMDAVVVNVLPLKRQRLPLPKSGEKDQPVEHRMNWIVELVHGSGPGGEIIDHLPARRFAVPFDCDGRAFGQIERPSGMVPDRAKLSQGVFGPGGYPGHFTMTLNDHRLGDLGQRQSKPILSGVCQTGGAARACAPRSVASGGPDRLPRQPRRSARRIAPTCRRHAPCRAPAPFRTAEPRPPRLSDSVRSGRASSGPRHPSGNTRSLSACRQRGRARAPRCPSASRFRRSDGPSFFAKVSFSFGIVGFL